MRISKFEKLFNNTLLENKNNTIYLKKIWLKIHNILPKYILNIIHWHNLPWNGDDERFFFKSPEELMDHFKLLLNERINPKIDSLFLNSPTLPLEIVEIPPEMGGGPAAYYIAGTADGSRPGKFFVNTKRYNSQPRYECISLALHEGNPGHHLQSSFSMVTQPPLPKFRQFMEDRSYFLAPSRFPINTAFVEG